MCVSRMYALRVCSSRYITCISYVYGRMAASLTGLNMGCAQLVDQGVITPDRAQLMMDGLVGWSGP